MMIRDHIELGFRRWSGWLCDHARLVVALTLLLCLGLSSQLPRLTFDTSDESFLHESDPVRLAYDATARSSGVTR